jgi:hypothetical protein
VIPFLQNYFMMLDLHSSGCMVSLLQRRMQGMPKRKLNHNGGRYATHFAPESTGVPCTFVPVAKASQGMVRCRYTINWWIVLQQSTLQTFLGDEILMDLKKVMI